MLGHEAVILNWRLFWRSLRQSSGELWLVVAVALLAAATMGGPAMEFGRALASGQVPPGQLGMVLAPWLWASFVASFAFAIATSELNFIRSLLADFALRPVSRWQALVTTQAVWTAGPHALALPSAGLPLLIVFAIWLDGTALVLAITAAFVMMRLPAGLLLISSRVLSAPIAIIGSVIGVAVVMAAGVWLTAPDLILAWSPPGLVARILIDDGRWRAWTGLALWTLVVAAIEYWSAGLDLAPRVSPSARTQAARSIPSVITFFARLGGTPPVLLHGELLRLIRWKRYRLSWLAGGFLVALIGGTLNEHAGAIRIVFVSLLPVQVGGSVLANLFATDRAAVHALLMVPAGVHAVLRSKVLAVLVFCVAGELATAALLLARDAAWPLVGAGVILAAGLFMWTTAVGLITSVLFPSASDPQTVGGALVNAPAFAASAVSSSLYLGTSMGLAYMFEWGHWPGPTCALAVAALVLGSVFAMRRASALSPRLVALRQERMLSTLTAPGARA